MVEIICTQAEKDVLVKIISEASECCLPASIKCETLNCTECVEQNIHWEVIK